MGAWLDEQREWLARAEDRWRPRMSEPLRLRAWLTSSIAWDGYDGMTALEGALQTVVVWREAGRMPADVFAGCGDAVVDIPIPIADVEIAGRRVACASWAVPPPIAVETLRYRRHRARVEAMRLHVVRINQGDYKSQNRPEATLTTPFVDIFVRGDRERLSALLADVGAIGRVRGIGFGTVLTWDIENDAEDRSLVWHGAPQRAIPIEHGGPYDPRNYAPGSYVERECGVRAPYWLLAHKAACAIPAGPFGAPAWEAA